MEPIISTNTDDIELASSHPKSSTTSALKLHISTALGEFIGTTVFLFLAEGAAKTAKLGRSVAETETKAPLDSTTVLVIATSFGLSLIISAWAFFRITGGLFNPAITLALWFVGVITTVRAIFLAIVQILGGITAAALVLALTPLGANTNGVDTVNNTLTDVSIAQGFFLEMLGTSILVFTVLLLAVEKHRATFMAPVGIGLTLFAIHLFLVPWTGCGVNPARAFGPAAISGHFPNYHWIYWIAPLCGTLFAVFYYELLKVLEYNNAVLAIDGEKQISIIQPAYIRIYRRFFG